MHVHLPKAFHGWAEIAREIAIIVVGVLIALAGEAIVQSIHDRDVAAQARDNVRAEAATNLSFIRDRLDVQGCIERRLDSLSRILAQAGNGAMAQQPSWIARPPTAPFFRGRWEAATASGRNSLFPFLEQQRFAQLYEIFSRFDDYQGREQLVWARLRALETWQGPLGAEGRLSFADALEQARYFAWDLNYAGTFALQNGISMGLLNGRSQMGHAAICLPITTSRAEALRKLNTKFGEP